MERHLDPHHTISVQQEAPPLSDCRLHLRRRGREDHSRRSGPLGDKLVVQSSQSKESARLGTHSRRLRRYY
jgi:hypothetical protein